MKKPTINYEWPVKFFDFDENENSSEKFSRGKLEVFYKGETADHRFFSDTFSQNLVQTLPYTPIVSYYDEEKDDFVGHATEQQILGIVDPCREISFKKDEDGREWCVCDVVLYTERPDKVGSIAKKIIGHKQSLELDPKTTKYVINYDEKKHFKNIEFTDGSFVGVSVLGNDQKPAFSGSHFFTCDEQFENKMKILRDYCEHANDQKTQNGGKGMNLQEFMKLSWGDISLKVEEKICNEYAQDAYTHVVDMFEDSAIVRFYYYVEGVQKLMRVKYSISAENEIVLGEINEVCISYEDVEQLPNVSEEIDIIQAKSTEIEAEDKVDAGDENPSTSEDITTYAELTEVPINEDDTTVTTSDNNIDLSSDVKKSVENNFDKTEDVEPLSSSFEEDAPAHVEDVQITTTEDSTKVSVEDEKDSLKEENSSSTSFTDSERAELEALKREKKVTLVNSYREQISEEDFNSFSSKVDEFSIEDLELALLKAYKRFNEENAEQSIKPMRAFAFAPKNANSENNNSLDSFVRKNLKK